MENRQTDSISPEAPRGQMSQHLVDGSVTSLRFGPRPLDQNILPGLRSPSGTSNGPRQPLHPLLRGRVIRGLVRERITISCPSDINSALGDGNVPGQPSRALPRQRFMKSSFVRTIPVALNIYPGLIDDPLGNGNVPGQIQVSSQGGQVQATDSTALDRLVAVALSKANPLDTTALDRLVAIALEKANPTVAADTSSLDCLATAALNNGKFINSTLPRTPARRQFLSSMQDIMGPDFMTKWKLLEGTETYEKIMTRGIGYRWSRWTVVDKEIMWELKRRRFHAADIGLILGRTQAAIRFKLQEI